jgi:hypothetical protein
LGKWLRPILLRATGPSLQVAQPWIAASRRVNRIPTATYSQRHETAAVVGGDGHSSTDGLAACVGERQPGRAAAYWLELIQIRFDLIERRARAIWRAAHYNMRSPIALVQPDQQPSAARFLVAFGRMDDIETTLAGEVLKVD